MPGNGCQAWSRCIATSARSVTTTSAAPGRGCLTNLCSFCCLRASANTTTNKTVDRFHLYAWKLYFWCIVHFKLMFSFVWTGNCSFYSLSARLMFRRKQNRRILCKRCRLATATNPIKRVSTFRTCVPATRSFSARQISPWHTRQSQPHTRDLRIQQKPSTHRPVTVLWRMRSFVTTVVIAYGQRECVALLRRHVHVQLRAVLHKHIVHLFGVQMQVHAHVEQKLKVFANVAATSCEKKTTVGIAHQSLAVPRFFICNKKISAWGIECFTIYIRPFTTMCFHPADKTERWKNKSEF